MAQSLISELAQRLGKSEEEVLRFFQTLWQVMPPSPETQPYFFRYLDERFLRLEDRYTTLRQEMHQQIEALRKEMQQGDANLLQQIEALRKEMQQGNEALRKEMQQENEALRKEMQQGNEALRKEMQQGDANLMQQIEMLRKEMQHNDALLRQEIEALRRHVERVERLLFALTVPVLVSTLGILVLLFKPG
jgi:D-ribose pyranose/furanose isomerase RbsD